MTYTLRNIPEELNEALRTRAEQERRPVEEVAIDALRRGLDVKNGDADRPRRSGGQKHRDLSDIAGTWIEDPEVQRALDEFQRVNAEELREFQG